MENRSDRLVLAHHPDQDFLQANYNLYTTDKISIASYKTTGSSDFASYLHSHDAYEFIIPQTPIPVLILDHAHHFGEVGYVYPVTSSQEHGIRFKITNIAYDQIVIDKDYMDSVIERKGFSGITFSSKFEFSHDLNAYIQLFKNEFLSKEKGDLEKLQSLMTLITITLVEQGLSNPQTDKKENPIYQKGISSVATYINQHYDEDINIDLLAEMCGLTKNYFISAFRKAIGETPYSYLCKLRISKAKILLETTDDSIQTVALNCGFKKSNTFTTLFKNATGQTPSEYKRYLKQIL